MKRYLVDLQMNTRDLGGYQNKDGAKIIEQRFIRSDVPQYLSPAGRDFFYGLGIKTVLDFRTEEIANRYPSVFANDSRFSYHLFPIVEGSNASKSKTEDSPKTYMKMLSHYDTFKGIFRAILSSAGNVFYHCTAGKDRTGIVSFLLLDLVGVDDQTMIDDYACSEVFINERIKSVREAHPDFPSSLGFSKADYMIQFIHLFRTRYGTSEAYLRLLGFSEDEIKQIKHKLIGPK